MGRNGDVTLMGFGEFHFLRTKKRQNILGFLSAIKIKEKINYKMIFKI